MLRRQGCIRISARKRISESAEKRLTPATITDRLAAMTHNVGDLFIDDMDLLLMVVEYTHDGYWICEDVSGRSSGTLWYKTDEVTAGKKLLDKAKNQ